MKYNKGVNWKETNDIVVSEGYFFKEYLLAISFICTSITADCSFLDIFESTDPCLIKVIMHFFPSSLVVVSTGLSITIKSYYNIIGLKFLPNVTIISS